jgi:ATP-dependent Clp protease ATP-binding subunit ClpC
MQYIKYILIAALVVASILYYYRNKLKIGIKKSTGGGISTLSRFSKDLTQLAKEGKIDPAIGRTKEITRVIQVLSRRKKNNPVLIGPPGVGKTAIAEGLALEIVNGHVPEAILGKRVLTLDLVGMMAGTKYRGEFEQRLKTITREIESAERNIIVFIDELHILAETRGTEGAIATSDILKPALARGALQAIGATTPQEYEQYIKPDLTLERRFQPVKIGEPTIKVTIEILKGLRKIYEDYHKVKITDDALIAAAGFSKYIKNRYLPDKAIDLIDEASARVRLGLVCMPARVIRLAKQVKDLEKKKKKISSARRKAEIDEKIKKCQAKMKIFKAACEGKKIQQPIVTIEEIKEIISEWIDVPIEKIV